MLIFLQGLEKGLFYLQFVLELNNKKSTLREITPKKHELITNYQFLISDDENNSILFSIPQESTVAWMNSLKKSLSFKEPETSVSVPNTPTSAAAKERMFDTFVSMKENQRASRQKPNKPETGVDLVNGLPYFEDPKEAHHGEYKNQENEKPASPNTAKLLSVKKFLTRKQ